MKTSNEYGAQKLLEEAKNNLFQYNLKGAINLTEQAINMDGNLIEAYKFLSHLYFHFEKDHLKAHETIDKAIEIEENEYLSHKVKGDIYYDEKKFREAVECYKKALDKLCTIDSSLITQIGNCYINMGNKEEAKRYFHSAVDADPLCIDAIRKLRVMCVENKEYTKAFELWSMDNLIDENTNGTIKVKASNIKNALQNFTNNSMDYTTLISLGNSYYSAALYEDAAIVYEKVLKVSPSNSEIAAKVKLIKDYLKVLEEFRETSIKIYDSIIHGEKINKKKHKQMLYDILLKLDSHFEELKGLPNKISKKSWKIVRKLYLKEFNLHIHDYFKRKIHYGTYASYVINEEPIELNLWNKKGNLQIIELGMDIEKEYTAWVWKYFGAQTGGWVDFDARKTIYYLSDAYKFISKNWMAITDERMSKGWMDKASKDLNYDDYAVEEVFYSEGLSDRFLLKFRNQVYTEATKKYEDEKDQKKYFFKKIYEIKYKTLIAHEGQHSIDMCTILSNIKACLYALTNKTNGFESAYEYRSKLTELYYSENLYDSLATMMSKDINSSSHHGKANTLVFKRFVKYIKDNPNEFQQIDTSKNILLQLDMLDIAQIGKIAEYIF